MVKVTRVAVASAPVRTRMLTIVVLSLGLLALFVRVPGAEASVFWANFNNATGTTIGRANNNGTGAMPFVGGADGPCGVAVDASYLYWANWAFGSTPTIGRVNLEGLPVPEQSFIPAGGPAPCGVAVDGAHVYWANTGFGAGTTIGRADIDGGNPDPGFIGGASGPCGVAVDDTYIYWANNAAGSIGRATLDGVTVEPSFIPNAGPLPCGVAVDDMHVYWANSFGGTTVQRAKLDGSNVEPFVTDAISPCGVAVSQGVVYWANIGDGTIGRAPADGNGVELPSFIETANSPCGVAVSANAVPANVPAMSSYALLLALVVLSGIAARRVSLARRAG